MIDTVIRDAVSALQKVAVLHQFLEDMYYEWYCVGDRLFVIHDVLVDAYYFIDAHNPSDALRRVKARWEEIAMAGEEVQDEQEGDR